MPQKAGTDTIFKLPKIESVPVFCFVYYTLPYLWIRVLRFVLGRFGSCTHSRGSAYTRRGCPLRARRGNEHDWVKTHKLYACVFFAVIVLLCVPAFGTTDGSRFDPAHFTALGTLTLSSGSVAFDTTARTVTGFGNGTLAQTEIPVMLDMISVPHPENGVIPDIPPGLPAGNYITRFNHLPGGCNCLYLDGHVEYIRYGDKFPATAGSTFYLGGAASWASAGDDLWEAYAVPSGLFSD